MCAKNYFNVKSFFQSYCKNKRVHFLGRSVYANAAIVSLRTPQKCTLGCPTPHNLGPYLVTCN